MPGRGTPKKQTSTEPGIQEDDEALQGAMDNERRLPEAETSVGQKKWNVIRQKMLRSTTGSGPIQHSTPAQIPVTTELLAGQLPVMILKTWIDRDEKGHRAVPILLGNMRFRVGDSAGFGDEQIQRTGREVFRIECEYGDGIVKWVGRPSGRSISLANVARLSRSSIESFEISFPCTVTTRQITLEIGCNTCAVPGGSKSQSSPKVVCQASVDRGVLC